MLTPLNEPRTVRALPLYDYGPHPRRRRSPWRRGALGLLLAGLALLAALGLSASPSL